MELSDVIFTKIQTKAKQTPPIPVSPASKTVATAHKPTLNQSKLHSQVKWALSMHFPSNDGPFFYATQIVNQPQDALVLSLLEQLSKSQKKLLSIGKQTTQPTTQTNAHPTTLIPVLKRRYCQGLNEVQKYLSRNRVKLVIITKNIPLEDEKVVSRLEKVLDYAWLVCVPVVFALTKNQLGSAIHFSHSTTLGIFSVDGINITELLDSAKQSEEMWMQEFCKVWNEEHIPRNLLAPHGESPIWIAAKCNHRNPGLILKAVKLGWDVDAPDSYNGYTPLLVACKHHHYIVVANLLGINLLESEAFNVHISKHIKLWTLVKEKLDWSDRIHDLKELKRLDIDLTIKSFSGESCLHLAIGSPIILTMLLNRAERDGILPLLLQSRCLGKTAIQLAVEKLDIDSFQQLFSPSTKPQLYENGSSLHHLAGLVYYKKGEKLREMTRVLVEKLGKVGLETRLEGLTPLMLGCKDGNSKFVFELVNYLASPSAPEEFKVTTKPAKVEPKKKLTVQDVLSTALDVKSKPSQAPTTEQPKKTKKQRKIKKTASSLFPSLTKTAVSMAHVNLQDSEQRTALWWACWRGSWDCVKLLMDVGADASIGDVHGKKPEDVVGLFAVNVHFDSSEPEEPEHDKLHQDVEDEKNAEDEENGAEEDLSSEESDSSQEMVKKPKVRRKDLQRIRTLFSKSAE